MKKYIYMVVTCFVLSASLVAGQGILGTPSAKAASSVTYTVTADTLNVRSGSSTKHKVIGSVKKGSKLSVQKKESNGWYKITFKGKTGYVSGTYVKAASASTTTYTVTADTLNVRSGSSTNYKVIGSVKKGTKLTVQKKESNGWYKIDFKGKTGYVSGTYVKAATSSSVSSKSSIEDTVNNMKTLGKAQQLILVTSSNASSKTATIRTFEKTNGKWKQVQSMTGVLGKNGMTDKMSEGSQASPTGKYTIGTAFGRGANPGTKLPYRKITSDDVWVDDPASSLYNTWQKASKNNGRWKSAEKMNIPEYDLGFVINYNTKNPVAGKGSAIFFHVAGKYGYTAGCTATSKANVTTVLKWLSPDKNPVIIQTPDSGLGKY
ncbi:SH3 domain-containing protein [Paenibacillus alvei]